MTSIEYVTLEVADPTAADAFYGEAFGLGDTVSIRASQVPTTGFHGFTLSLMVSQPSTVDSLVASALGGGATTLKAVLRRPGPGRGEELRQQVRRVRHRGRAPDGFIWEATSA
ncbi:MAG TPA: hypothetical protein VIR00_07530 [Micromonosporaceae bacterium]